MRSFSIFLILLLSTAVTCPARFVDPRDLRALVGDAKLVFVGRVKSVKPSGITTGLAYVTWKDIVYEWLMVDVEVVEPIKGTKKGTSVRTLMLSVHTERLVLVNPPGMVHPKVGEYHLHCLLPTSLKGTYAAVTAPFDDDRSIHHLDRKSWNRGTHYKVGREVPFYEQNEENRVLWELVNAKGRVQPKGVERLRTKFRAEIAKQARKDSLIHLEWKKASSGGWEWSEPAEGGDKAKQRKPSGPISSTRNPFRR